MYVIEWWDKTTEEWRFLESHISESDAQYSLGLLIASKLGTYRVSLDPASMN